jgi:hypothetical protein
MMSSTYSHSQHTPSGITAHDTLTLSFIFTMKNEHEEIISMAAASPTTASAVVDDSLIMDHSSVTSHTRCIIVIKT